MKTITNSPQIKIFAFILLFIAISLISSKAFQGSGPHGGTVKKAENFFIEITSPDKIFYAYLLDLNSKTISNKGISGDAKFFLPDSSIFVVQLKPSDGDGFSGEGIPGYSACKITFNIFGNPASATFQNMTLLARK